MQIDSLQQKEKNLRFSVVKYISKNIPPLVIKNRFTLFSNFVKTQNIDKGESISKTIYIFGLQTGKLL